MKSLTVFIILFINLLLMQESLYCQDITAILGGNTSSDGFSVVNAQGDTIFRVTGEGNVGIGTSNPFELLEVKQKFGPVGKSVNIEAGTGINPSNGGDINLLAGNGNSIPFRGGNVNIVAGKNSGPSTYGGQINLASGQGGENGGNINITTGKGSVFSGSINIKTGVNYSEAGDGLEGIFGGRILLSTVGVIEGNNDIEIITGDLSTSIADNDIKLTAGNGLNEGGSIQLTPGISTLNGKNGTVVINGSGTYTGSWTSSSDIRFKKDIKPLENTLETVKSLNGVSYKWNTEEFPEKKFQDDEQIGLIAQDVEKVIPSLVDTDSEGYKSVDYIKLNVLLLEAIKEQQLSIDVLKQEIEELKKMTGSESNLTELIDNKE